MAGQGSSSSDDGEIVAGSRAAAGQSTAASAPRARQPQPRASPAKSVAGSLQEEGAGENEQARSSSDTGCFLCRKVGVLTQVYRGYKLHGPCYNAVRSHDRYLTKEQKKEVTSELHDNPEAWRKRVLPLVCAPGQKRNSQQRHRAKSTIQQQFQKTQTSRDILRLPLCRYVKYRTWWDGLSAEEATAAFWEGAQEQGSGSENENSDGEVLVPVRDNVRCSRITGDMRATRTMVPEAEEEEEEDGDDATEAHMTSLAPAASFAIVPRVGDRDSNRKRGPPGASPSDDVFKTPPAKKAARLTATALQSLSSRRTAAASSTSAKDGGDAASTISVRQVHLLQQRAELQQQVRLAVDEATSPRSDFAILTKKLQACDPEKLKIMDVNAEVVLEALRLKLVEPLQQLQKDMATAHLRELDTKKVGHPSES